jgi:hypothetical protein
VQEDEADEIDAFEDIVINTVKITLMGGADGMQLSKNISFQGH